MLRPEMGEPPAIYTEGSHRPTRCSRERTVSSVTENPSAGGPGGSREPRAVEPVISPRDVDGQSRDRAGDLDAPVGCRVDDRSGSGLPGPTGKHDWHYLGRSPLPHPHCEQPIVIACNCGTELVKRCGATRISKCAPCAESHRRRLQVLIRSGICSDGLSTCFFLTLTAPGVDVLPWDEAVCSHDPEVACSGTLGCTVERIAAADWNGTAARRWSWFMTYVRRLLPGVTVDYCGTWEDQKRGVLHRHVVVRCDQPVTLKRFRVVARSAARRWGFGAQLDVKAIDDASAAAAARYIAKYASKTSDTSPDRVVLDRETGELRSGRCVRPWSASWGWGDSMRVIRERQRAFIVANPGWQPTRLAGAGGAGRGAGGALDPNQKLSTDPPSAGRSVCGVALDHVGM